MYTFCFCFKDGSNAEFSDVTRLVTDEGSLDAKDFESEVFPRLPYSKTIRLFTKDGQVVVSGYDVKWYQAYRQN